MERDKRRDGYIYEDACTLAEEETTDIFSKMTIKELVEEGARLDNNFIQRIKELLQEAQDIIAHKDNLLKQCRVMIEYLDEILGLEVEELDNLVAAINIELGNQ